MPNPHEIEINWPDYFANQVEKLGQYIQIGRISEQELDDLRAILAKIPLTISGEEYGRLTARRILSAEHKLFLSWMFQVRGDWNRAIESGKLNAEQILEFGPKLNLK